MTTAGLNIELIVRCSDGSFEGRLSIPVDSTDEQRESIAKSWMAMFREAVSIIPRRSPNEPLC